MGDRGQGPGPRWSLSRRDFLERSALGALGLALGGVACSDSGGGGRGARPPNLLVIMSDEHNARVLGAAGNPVARTPNLDALASRGVLFENAYCNSPLCVASRLSFTSGKYASRSGVWSNAFMLPSDDVVSLPRVLQTRGYETFLCGKMHYDRTRRYGFTELPDSCYQRNTNYWDKSGILERRDPDDFSREESLLRRFRGRDFGVSDQSWVMRQDRKITRRASEFLSTRSRDDAPFYLHVGHIAPHFPLVVEEAFWKPFEGRIPPPQAMDAEALAREPRNYRQLRAKYAFADLDPEVSRFAREVYYGLCSWVDDQIGQVLAALEESEVARDTVVVYTSDHGEMMGERGMWWKSCMYEDAVRVPLIVSWPERWAGGQRRSGVCSLVDLVRTLTELGGAQTPADWDGRSLVALNL